MVGSVPHSQPLSALWQPPFHLELRSAPDLLLLYYAPASSSLSMLQLSVLQAGQQLVRGATLHQ